MVFTKKNGLGIYKKMKKMVLAWLLTKNWFCETYKKILKIFYKK